MNLFPPCASRLTRPSPTLATPRYLNGHAHTLTHYGFGQDSGYFVTTGAGAMVNTADQWGGSVAKDRTYNKVHGLPVAPVNLKTYQQIWNQRVAGFTTHTLSADGKSLKTDFVTYDGETVHTFTVQKGGSGPSPPSPPAPSPSPPPPSPSPLPSSCCYYDAKQCTKGQVCCTESGKSYTQSSCEGVYGQRHHCAWAGGECIAG